MTPPKDVEQEVRRHSALVWSIVRRYAGTGRDPDDLFQIGAIGLIKAMEGFDESFGTCFSTYAVPKIAGEIRRFLRDDGTIKVSRLMKEKAYALAKARREFENKNGQLRRCRRLAAGRFFEFPPLRVKAKAFLWAPACRGFLFLRDNLQIVQDCPGARRV